MATRHKTVSMDHPAVITLLMLAIIAFMYEAADVLKPLSLAILLSFALVPISRLLERVGLPRVPSVLLTVILVLGGLGFVGYQVGQELSLLANNLDSYETNVKNKIARIQPKRASPITKISQVVGDVKNTMTPEAGKKIPEVRVISDPNLSEQTAKVIGPYLEGLGVASIVLILLLYLMINREDMSDRLIRLFGRGRISLTTRTIEEVGQRISKYLVMFASVNTTYGVVIGLGLWAIGIPYSMLWGFLAASLRFIPYAGPATAFVLPLLFAIASSEGWARPLEVLALFGVVESLATVLLEPVVYGKTTGISALALLVAAMFWTWLWGAVGLFLSTPLTVCLAVLGKYVPSLSFFATFLREEVDLDPGVRFYQRLLAMDQDGATGIIEASLKKHPRAEVFDKVLIPTLSLSERDFAHGDIDERELTFIHRVTQDVLDDLAGEPEVDLATLSTASEASARDGQTPAPVGMTPRILALPATDASDVLALKLLAMLLESSGVSMEIVEEAEPPLKVVDRIEAEVPDVVLISHLPPDGLTAARYLTRRIRARHDRLPILVGRWDGSGEASTSRSAAAERLTSAGASVLFSSLAEARDYLVGLARPKATPSLDPATV